MASGSSDKTVRLWECATGFPRRILEGHLDSVNAVAFSPNSKLVASASNDCTVRVWDSATGAAIQILQGHQDSVTAAAFSVDGKAVVSGSGDKTVRFWNSATGMAIKTLEVDVAIKDLSFSRDGAYLETDQGRLHISSVSSSNISLQPSAKRGLFIEKDWVTYKGNKVLWLPSEYRAMCFAIRNNVAVLGHASGRITVLVFNLSNFEYLFCI